MVRYLLLVLFLICAANLTTLPVVAQQSDVWDRVNHQFATNDGVEIHYVTLGEGPLIVMIHGFPDFWYLWRDYITALSDDYQVVAMDLRGYNRSGRPAGVENYSAEILATDVAAVIQHSGHESATVVGHDWGGFVAWSFAMYQPDMTKSVIIFNLPHPRGLQRELAQNPKQQENSAYARRFQQDGAHLQVTSEQLAGIRQMSGGRDELSVDRERHLAALGRSDFEGMLNYYKANYPKPPYQEDEAPLVVVEAPVLQFHGLDDAALLNGMLNNTWNWLEREFTLVTIPGAGHWAVTEKSDFTIPMMRAWLTVQELGR